MARPVAQPMPATMASPSMVATQNPFARSMEDGGVVYMENGGNPLKKIYDSVVSGAKKVGEFLSSGQSPSQMEYTSDPDKVSAYTEALANTKLKDNVTGYGNILNFDDLKTTFTGGDPGDAALRAAFNDLTFADQQAVRGIIDTTSPFGRESNEEIARNRAVKAYRDYLVYQKDEAGNTLINFGTRGDKDLEAWAFNSEDVAGNPNHPNYKIYSQKLYSRGPTVGFTDPDTGLFRALTFNNAEQAKKAGIVYGSKEEAEAADTTGDDPTGDDTTPTPTPTPISTPVVQPTVVPTPTVTQQVAPIQPVATTPADPFQRPANVPSPYANPFEASPSLFDVQQLATSPFSSRFGDENLTIYDSLAPFTGGQQPQPQTFEEIMAQFDPFNPLKNQV